MDPLTTLLIAVGLGMDAFAVALGVGTLLKSISLHPTPSAMLRASFRLSWHFGLFQFLMPIVGWLAGTSVVSYIAAYDHWVAFGLLAFVGGRMIHSAWHGDGAAFASDPTRGVTLVLLSVATSIDALAVGLGLAVLGVEIFYPSLIIGLTAAAMTVAGLHLGRRLGALFGRRMEFVGGLILIGIGVRVLIAHLWA